MKTSCNTWGGVILPLTLAEIKSPLKASLSAEISPNAEYNLRREQQHNHLPRPGRHYGQSYEPKEGEHFKNQY